MTGDFSSVASWYDAAMLEAYRRDDWLADMLTRAPAALTCHRWLEDSPAKRMIYADLYGDLLRNLRGLRILDIGGGLTGLTALLAERHDYHLVDIMAHDLPARVEDVLAGMPGKIWAGKDWHGFSPQGPYDLIIANDLFPNVDQRLALFLSGFMPHARALRLSLTLYQAPRFYQVKRTDADEIMCLLAWNSSMLQAALTEIPEAAAACAGLAAACGPSLFPNGRQVARLWLKGGAS